VAGGFFLYAPFIQAKVAGDFGKYLHLSAGLLAYAPVGYNDVLHGQLAASVGTQDYFVNFCATQSLHGSSGANNLAGFGMGFSARTGRKSRVFFETHTLFDEMIYYYDERGRLREFTLGASWFNGRHHFDFGISVWEELYEDGFSGFNESYFYALPAVTYSYRFGNVPKRGV
jgi:hypothetical protein